MTVRWFFRDEEPGRGRHGVVGVRGHGTPGRRQVLLTALAILLMASTGRGQQFLAEVRPLADGRQMHGTAVMGDYLYVFGGFTLRGQSTGGVMKAPILPDGSIGEWTDTTPLPAPRLYIGNCTVVMNDTVYIICGSYDPINPRSHSTILYSRPGADGSLTPWQESAPIPIPEGLSAPAAVSTPGYIHVIGGLSGGQGIADVWSIGVNPDGSLRDWEKGPSLPQPIWYNQAATVGGRAFVWGGIPGGSDSKTASPMVYSAPVLGGGQLGAWKAEAQSLPVPFYGASTAVAGPYLLNFSPRVSGGALTSDIWWTLVLPTGIQAWQKLPTQVPAKIYHAATADYRRGNIYLNGGRPERNPTTPQTFSLCFRLSPAAREVASGAWETRTQGGGATDDTLTQAPQQASTSSGFSYQTAGTLPLEAVSGFRTITDARQRLRTGQAAKLIVYFTSRSTKTCREQNELLRAPTFGPILAQGNFAWLDVNDNPQEAQALGVWRVPTWVAYDAAGQEIGRQVGTMNPEQFQ